MSELSEKLIDYGGLEHFRDLLLNDSGTTSTSTWSSSKISGELAAKQGTLTASQNIEIAANTISAKGYFYDGEPKTELKLIDDILREVGLPAGVSLGLKVSGAAGATTYSWTDDLDGTFIQAIQHGMLPGVGATYQTANGKSGVIAAVDATTITFEKTLDADNALTDEPVDYVITTTQLFSFAEGIIDYIELDISQLGLTLSGAAGATTYTYDRLSMGESLLINSMLRLQDGRSAKCVSVDTTNHTITFESTFDAENALADEPVVSLATKNIASGKYSHVEGGGTLEGAPATNTASGTASHAEGIATNAIGNCSHAEGAMTTAGDWGSHSEGRETVASGYGSHAEGYSTNASDEGSHSEGRITTASGKYSHAEGYGSEASGEGSHAEGYGTETQNRNEHAEGSYNLSHKNSDINPSRQNPNGDAGNTLHSIGNGYWQSVAGQPNKIQKNVLEIMQNGDMYVLGIGGYQGTDTKVQDATIKTLQEYIASLEARIAALENPNA